MSVLEARSLGDSTKSKIVLRTIYHQQQRRCPKSSPPSTLILQHISILPPGHGCSQTSHWNWKIIKQFRADDAVVGQGMSPRFGSTYSAGTSKSREMNARYVSAGFVGRRINLLINVAFMKALENRADILR